MRHEEETDATTHEPPPERRGLMALNYSKRDLSRQPVTITWEVPTHEMAHQVAALSDQADRVANYVQGLPTREDFDALVADLAAAQQMIASLLTERRAA